VVEIGGRKLMRFWNLDGREWEQWRHGQLRADRAKNIQKAKRGKKEAECAQRDA
jgi:hypothetical protein